MSCPNCSKEHKRSKTGLCATCYMKVYRSTPNGHKRSLDAIKRYQKKNPEKRFKHVVRYRERTGYYVPLDLHLLRTAAKPLKEHWQQPKTVRQLASQVNTIATKVLNGEIDLEIARLYSSLTRVLVQSISVEVTKARFAKLVPDLNIDDLPTDESNEEI